MRTFKSGWMALMLFVTGVTPASAGLIHYATSFEEPDFTAGSPLGNYPGWYYDGLSDGSEGVISTLAANTGSQSLRVDYSRMGTPPAGGQYFAGWSFPIFGNPDFTAANFVSITASMRMDIDPATTSLDGDLIYMGISSASPTTSYLAGSAEIRAGSGGMLMTTPGLGVTTTPYVSGTWATMQFDFDFLLREVDILRDGSSLGRFAFPGDAQSRITGVYFYFASIGQDNHVGYLDDVSIRYSTSVVPEPSSLALAGIGLAALGLVRAKQRKRAVR